MASRISGIPELVIDGETGFLVEPKDINQLAQKIMDLLDDTALQKTIRASRTKENRR